ncbi:hypothetical protein [uncultured Methylobacterium sp.]|uniref:hypothetical protein n=1 Tax=uncultured Methylobacterium sp. TaxID=157278 RepID=UPI0035CC90F6
MSIPNLDRRSEGQADALSEAGSLLEAEDTRLLVDIGFMALSHGFVASAEEVFLGVIAARPAQEAGQIGIALARLHRGAVDDAVTILRRLPPSDAARLFLGLALNRQGDAEQAQSILGDVAASAGAPFSRTAQDLLEAMRDRSGR